jgi:hypothetical protein
VRAADDALEDHDLVGRVPPLHIDPHVGQRPQETLVIPPDLSAAAVVLVVRLVVVPGRFRVGLHDALQIVLVLEADVLFDQRDPGLYELTAIAVHVPIASRARRDRRLRHLLQGRTRRAGSTTAPA